VSLVEEEATKEGGFNCPVHIGLSAGPWAEGSKPKHKLDNRLKGFVFIK
jgi:hypothetical protein